jgi:hypothetical protein
MSIFGDILSKIFHTQAPGSAAQTQKGPVQKPAVPTAEIGQSAVTQQKPKEAVDVEKVLSDLAAKKGGGGNWRTSVVDLLKLLDLDSSLAARKELAQELNVHAGADGSAEQNIALQKAVWKKLAENGGKVPASLQS